MASVQNAPIMGQGGMSLPQDLTQAHVREVYKVRFIIVDHDPPCYARYLTLGAEVHEDERARRTR